MKPFSVILSLVCLLLDATLAVNYFPPGYFDSENVTKITWAHAVNSLADLQAGIGDANIKMLEADLVVGHLRGEENGSAIVVMAHPPATVSDLSFAMFLQAVIEYNQNRSLAERKGIKLDFKEIDAANMGIPLIKEKREENAEQTKFPIWINADILPGPINAGANKVKGEDLMKLQKENVPEGTLSIGWTTNYNIIIRVGKYSKEHVEEMATLIKSQYPQGNESVEITFPLRAGIAIQSLENIKYLLDSSGINFTSPSVTLWEGSADPRVNKTALDSFIAEVGGPGRVFVDLPYSFPQQDENVSAGETLRLHN